MGPLAAARQIQIVSTCEPGHCGSQTDLAKGMRAACPAGGAAMAWPRAATYAVPDRIVSQRDDTGPYASPAASAGVLSPRPWPWQAGPADD